MTVSPPLIALSALVTMAAIFWAALLLKWPVHQSMMAAVLSGIFLIVWRLVCNALGLNSDFVPAISLGDLGCLLAGALGPKFVSLRHHHLTGSVLAMAIGAAVAFVVNVVIL